jgi:hypothetical protein
VALPKKQPPFDFFSAAYGMLWYNINIMKVSTKFKNYIKKAVNLQSLIFVEITNIKFCDIEQVVKVRVAIKETNSGDICGHGIAIHSKNNDEISFYHNGYLLDASLKDIIADIYHVLPENPLTASKKIKKLTKECKDLEEIFNETADELGYVKAKLTVFQYENKPKEPTNPF